MTKIEFSLANLSDDGALRAVIRNSSMPGSISIALGREPSYFAAEKAGSVRCQTPVCRKKETGEIVGIAGRSFREVYVDGSEMLLGYLSSLRLLPESRSPMTVARGNKFFRALHADGAVPYYFTTIFDENKHAQQFLERGSAGMPIYVPFGMLVSYLIPIRKRLPRQHGNSNVARGNADLLPKAHACLRDWSKRYQLAPKYSLEDIAGQTSLLPHFSPKDLYVCTERGEAVGTLGVWNQQSFKQTIVTGYSRQMQMVRPFYNALARVRSRPILPNVGQSIQSVFASLVSVKDDDQQVFASLIEAAISDWSGRGHDFLVVGLSEDSPLSPVARKFANREVRAKVYLVHWPGETVSLPKSGTPIHLEVATL